MFDELVVWRCSARAALFLLSVLATVQDLLSLSWPDLSDLQGAENVCMHQSSSAKVSTEASWYLFAIWRHLCGRLNLFYYQSFSASLRVSSVLSVFTLNGLMNSSLGWWSLQGQTSIWPQEVHLKMKPADSCVSSHSLRQHFTARLWLCSLSELGMCCS